MRDGRDIRSLADAEDEIMGQLTCRTTGTVSDGDKRGREGLKVADCFVKLVPSGLGARWKKLEG